tara:strand:+ start:502 stop:642 length:141 start_codon:yes stop_codon:yes gene_type:complete
MAKCISCETKNGIVHSGTDGLILGVLDSLHKICYECANKRYKEKVQ